MNIVPAALQVQLWAPGVDASPLVHGLGHAGVQVIEVDDEPWQTLEAPLLLAYTDPLGCCQQVDVQQAVAAGSLLLEALLRLHVPSQAVRLVNLGCVCLPAVVGWCVQPAAPLQLPFPHRFSEPGPLDALLALELLHREPQLAATYLALEQHPLAARLDQRPVDGHCAQRYRMACGWDALRDARDLHNRLLHDIRVLADQLEPFQSSRLSALSLQEQIQKLSFRLDEAESLRQRCSDLELSLQAQQLDLEIMARRLTLLETLVTASSEASIGLQVRLAQVLSA
jgi:hypothetical protein